MELSRRLFRIAWRKKRVTRVERFAWRKRVRGMSRGEQRGEMVRRCAWVRPFHALRSFPRKRESRARYDASGILLLGPRFRGDERRKLRLHPYRSNCQTAGAEIRASAIAPVFCGAGAPDFLLPLAPFICANWVNPK